MNVTLVKDSEVLGKVTPKWVILHDGKFVCGGNTQRQVLDFYTNHNTHGTIQNHIRLGQYRKVAAMLCK